MTECSKYRKKKKVLQQQAVQEVLYLNRNAVVLSQFCECSSKTYHFASFFENLVGLFSDVYPNFGLQARKGCIS